MCRIKKLIIINILELIANWMLHVLSQRASAASEWGFTCPTVLLISFGPCGAGHQQSLISFHFPAWYISEIWCGQAMATLQGLQSTWCRFTHPRTSEAIGKGGLRSQWFISWVSAIALCTPGKAGVISDVWAACHTDHLSGGNYFWSIPTDLLRSGKCLPKTSTLIKTDYLIWALLGKELCPHYITAGN